MLKSVECATLDTPIHASGRVEGPQSLRLASKAQNRASNDYESYAHLVDWPALDVLYNS